MGMQPVPLLLLADSLPGETPAARGGGGGCWGAGSAQHAPCSSANLTPSWPDEDITPAGESGGMSGPHRGRQTDTEIPPRPPPPRRLAQLCSVAASEPVWGCAHALPREECSRNDSFKGPRGWAGPSPSCYKRREEAPMREAACLKSPSAGARAGRDAAPRLPRGRGLRHRNRPPRQGSPQASAGGLPVPQCPRLQNAAGMPAPLLGWGRPGGEGVHSPGFSRKPRGCL